MTSRLSGHYLCEEGELEGKEVKCSAIDSKITVLPPAIFMKRALYLSMRSKVADSAMADGSVTLKQLITS